jgi:hypothetical protein
MDELIVVSALTVVVLAAAYLVALGVAAFIRPGLARRFLGGFATTQRRHVAELGLRIVVGASLIISAPCMSLGTVFLGFGWVLITTSLGLGLVPWRLHQRFAAWSVPQATRYLPLIGLASLAGGVGLVVAVVLPRAPVS